MDYKTYKTTNRGRTSNTSQRGVHNYTNSAGSRGRGTRSYRGRGSGSGFGIGKIVIIALIVIAVLAAVCLLVGYAKSPTRWQCKEVIEQFQEGCNDLDAVEIINCLHPTVAATLNTVLLLGGAVSSLAPSDMLKQVFQALGGNLETVTQQVSGEGMDTVSAFESISIKPVRYGMPQAKRKVRCKATFGGAVSIYMNIYISKEEGEAYISKISFSS